MFFKKYIMVLGLRYVPFYIFSLMFNEEISCLISLLWKGTFISESYKSDGGCIPCNKRFWNEKNTNTNKRTPQKWCLGLNTVIYNFWWHYGTITLIEIWPSFIKWLPLWFPQAILPSHGAWSWGAL